MCVFNFIFGIGGGAGFAGGGGGGVWLNAGAAKAKPTAINMGTFSFISFHLKGYIKCNLQKSYHSRTIEGILTNYGRGYLGHRVSRSGARSFTELRKVFTS